MNDPSVVVVDCGVGNIQSVVNAFRRIGVSKVSVACNGIELTRSDASHLVLPGVGAVGGMLRQLEELDLKKPLCDFVLAQRKPFLGICVGMQVLAVTCLEFGEHAGLGWIPGRVHLLDTGDDQLPLPHVGWNEVHAQPGAALFADVADAEFYFAHSYAFDAAPENVAAYSDYGKSFPCAVQKENVTAIQFHAEKSSAAGERLLRNFIAMQVV